MKLTVDPLDKTYDLCMSIGNVKEKIKDIELITERNRKNA